jgi:hypothetical protein
MEYNGSEGIRLVGNGKFIFTNIQTGKKRISKYKNIIVTVCKEMIAKRLAQIGNDCNITYGALGTGITPPNITDTALVTELARKAISIINYSSGIVLTLTYFGSAEGNGVLTEFGLFGEDAVVTPPPYGTMICHAVISETKTSAESLTIEWNINIL